jgi:branched-chain amino acid transport system substrate-binding protein
MDRSFRHLVARRRGRCAAGGRRRQGLQACSTWHGANANFPVIQDIKKHVVDKKLSQVESADKVGQLLYNRGVYNSMLIAEGIRSAQKVTGKKAVTGEDVRRGLENINIDAAR